MRPTNASIVRLADICLNLGLAAMQETLAVQRNVDKASFTQE